MLPFPTFVSLDRSSTIALYLQISNGLVNAISSGLLTPGARLPGTRELAKLLDVHRKTIIAAYDELYAQSWIEVEPKKGARVAQNLPGLKARSWNKEPKTGYEGKMAVSFYSSPHKVQFPVSPVIAPDLVINEGLPDTRLAPLDLLFREYRSRQKSASSNKMVQGQATGSLFLRESLVPYLAETRGLHVDSSNIMITQGAQMSIYLAANLLLKTGDKVIVAEPSYFLANAVFAQAGAQILRVPVDGQGMDIQAVEQLCAKNKIRMLYVIPHHHHPTTVTLSPERRMHLLELAARYNFAIVEDDYDYDFHYTSAPYLPLASSKHEGRIIYIGSFSKTLSANVRIGFMIAPSGFIEEAGDRRRLIDLRSDQLLGDALAVLINNGDIGRYLKKTNKTYLERRDHCCNLLDRHLKDLVEYQKPDGGMAIWVKFKDSLLLRDVALRAAIKGLQISDGELYNTHKISYNSLRIGFASLTPAEMEKAILILKEASR
ncbi:PLP-dependent aminotransferase family protein [Pedobacter sp. HMWF019]|uniref:aminotransferase-like domain-containing protein n=1 Tax=Pedobacter sp. HMWF019 TaxID=2056856 RepID=UPI000D3A7DEC|nr:PLP-dependent aminotransferase family protein [Pedobacter sp. HMWF019]PTT03731.1 PLP-dependent aminotransferase family protein [Pedobacter sp. HMWF019]